MKKTIIMSLLLTSVALAQEIRVQGPPPPPVPEFGILGAGLVAGGAAVFYLLNRRK